MLLILDSNLDVVYSLQRFPSLGHVQFLFGPYINDLQISKSEKNSREFQQNKKGKSKTCKL